MRRSMRRDPSDGCPPGWRSDGCGGAPARSSAAVGAAATSTSGGTSGRILSGVPTC